MLELAISGTYTDFDKSERLALLLPRGSFLVKLCLCNKVCKTFQCIPAQYNTCVLTFAISSFMSRSKTFVTQRLCLYKLRALRHRQLGKLEIIVQLMRRFIAEPTSKFDGAITLQICIFRGYSKIMCYNIATLFAIILDSTLTFGKNASSKQLIRFFRLCFNEIIKLCYSASWIFYKHRLFNPFTTQVKRQFPNQFCQSV